MTNAEYLAELARQIRVSAAAVGGDAIMTVSLVPSVADRLEQIAQNFAEESHVQGE